MQVSIKDFPDWKKHTNKLIKLFSRKGWKFDEVRPEIVLINNEIRELPDNKNGLHGPWYSLDNFKKKDYSEEGITHTYLLSNYEKIDDKPIIKIYTHVLIQTALCLVEHFSIRTEINGKVVLHYLQEDGTEMNFDIAMKNIFYCALLNETAKWILADVVDANGNTWKESPLDKKDHLHECLTALCTYWVVNSNNNNNNIDLTKTFNWVFNELHNGNYSKYKEFLSEDIVDVIDATEIARFENIEKLEIFKHFCEKNINFANYEDSIHKGKLLKNKYRL